MPHYVYDLDCPLCRKPRPMHRSKPLYGTSVCRRCVHNFASRRQLAYVLDWILFKPLAWALGIVFTSAIMQMQLGPDAAAAASLAFAMVAVPVLFFCKDGMRGRSPGKLICGLVTVDRETLRPIGPVRSLKRNLILFVPFMPVVVAFMLLKGYRLGDGWARTRVVPAGRKRHHPVFTGSAACQKCFFDLTGNTSGVCPECGTPAVGATIIHCESCEFDLTGNTSGVCPECGAPIPDRLLANGNDYFPPMAA